ncbi:MAG TPA: hypothetical protein VF789_30815 [Thermoanaerobaculia bacterium]
MKALVLILGFFLLAASSSLATEVSYKDFVLLSHLNLAVCSNSGMRADTDILYYTGLARVLNDYVAAKVEEGALQPKKVEIKIACHTAEEAGPSIVDVSQNRRGYYIVMVRDVKPDLYQLVRIIDYFADKRWKPFCHDKWHSTVSPETAFRTFNRILDETVGKPDLSFFASRREVVLQRDELRVVYEAEQLFYEMTGQRLDLKPDDPLPVKLRDRYLFGSEGAVVVFADGKERRRKSPSSCVRPHPPIRAKVYTRWINIDCGANVLAYSYDRDRFYEVRGIQ